MNRVVVVIDSQQSTRRMIRFAMEHQGYRVEEIEDAAAVHLLLNSGCPDLLVIGINPGDADRESLVNEIRKQPVIGGLPIMLVGEAHLRPRWDLRVIDNCAWLNKPFRIGEFQGLAETLLSYSRFSPPRRTPPREGRHD